MTAGGSTGGGTVTLLFTDLVGSTEMLGELGDDAAEGVRRAHFRLLRDALVERSGQEVKNLGDGLMVVFDSAVDAVGSAVAMQQAVDRHNIRSGDGRLQVRVGLNIGDPIRDEDDYFGTPVVVAKRLCDRAGGGQILASEIVCRLVGTRGGFKFGDVEDVALKGIASPVEACDVLWEPASGQPIPLPPGVRLEASLAFVGRDEELERLRGAWDRVRGGQRRFVALSGDAGIGKTRLAGEFSRSVHSEGAAVMFGRCDEETLTPYQPFVEALREYVTTCPLDELRLQIAADRGELQTLVPELVERLPNLPPPLAGDPEGERYRLFESVASFLHEGSSDRPLILQLDDLHWADKPSLLLLRHVLRSSSESSLLILATYRETEVAPGHPFAELLADVHRDQLLERIALHGLQEPAVGGLISGWGGHEAPPEFVRAVFGETEGNPFFIQEILRHLSEAGVIFQREGRWASDVTVAEMGIPQGIRDVIGRRLGHLGDTARQSLTGAAMLGREFGMDVLCAVEGLTADEAVEVIDEALAAQLIVEEVGAVGRYRFAHALIRETLYQELSLTRRVRQHHLIGEHLERLYGGELDEHAAELAYHFISAGSAEDAERAVAYSLRAGARAATQLAYEEAALHYQRALDLETGDERERCALLLELGNAQWRSGDPGAAQTAFSSAAELARALREPELFAQAALGYGLSLGGAGFTIESDPDLVKLLEKALSMLDETDSTLRVRLLSRLATELYFTPSHERRAKLSYEAVQMAGRLSDPDAQLVALYSRHWAMLGPDLEIEERLAIGEEMIDLATAIGDREMTYRGHHIRLRTHMDMGEWASVEREVEACEQLASELREPFYRWQTSMFHTMRATYDGTVAELERLAQETFSLGQQGVHPELARTALGVPLLLHRYFTGRIEEMLAPLKQFADTQPWNPVWLPTLAFFAGEAGQHEQMRTTYERVAEKNFSDQQRDGNWSIAMWLLSLVCGSLGDSARAVVLYDMIAPYDDRIVSTGTGSITWGSLSTALGALAGTLDRWQTAAAHFEDALLRPEGRFAGVVTRREYARMLLARGRPDDLDRAATITSEGLEHTNELGMVQHSAELQALQAQIETGRSE